MDLFVILCLTALGLTILGATRVIEAESHEFDLVDADHSMQVNPSWRGSANASMCGMRGHPQANDWLRDFDLDVLDNDPLIKTNAHEEICFPKGSFGNGLVTGLDCEDAVVIASQPAEQTPQERSRFEIPGYDSVPYMAHFTSGEDIVTAVVCADAPRVKTVTHFDFEDHIHSRVIVDGRTIAVVRGKIGRNDVKCVDEASAAEIETRINLDDVA